MVPTARVMIRAAVVVGGIVLSASLALGQTNVPIDNSSLALSASTSTLAPIGAPKGQVQVIVRLSDPSLAAAVGPNAKRTGISWSGNQHRAYLAQLKSKQDAVMAQVAAMGGVELARVSKAHNAVVVQIDAQRLPDVARLPGVTKVRPVIDYEAALSDTVPYIGAKALQNLGIDGTGTKVAVLDTGIDYTHYNLGGPGTTTAYFDCYGTSPASIINKELPPPPSGYPKSKVIGGDALPGEAWPARPAAPAPKPLRAPAAGGVPGGDRRPGTPRAPILPRQRNHCPPAGGG